MIFAFTFLHIHKLFIFPNDRNSTNLKNHKYMIITIIYLK